MSTPRVRASGMVYERDAGDVSLARCPDPLGPYPVRLTDRLDHWADAAPTRVFLSERDPKTGAWRSLTYGSARARARGIAQSLIDLRLSTERPIAVLSGNSVAHALLGLGAMYAGVPFASLAPSYALADPSFTVLRGIWTSLTPGLVFAEEGDPFEPALAALDGPGTTIVTLSGRLGRRTVTSFADLEAPRVRTVDEARDRVTGSTIAKILFTSGSTGVPKGVINTQQNLCSNQEQICSVMQFLTDEPPVLCDWLPWNHTFGGSHNLGLVLYNGGTLFIDGGRPVGGAPFDLTLRNLRDTAPTIYLNVPRGYELLAGAFRADAGLRERFFRQVKVLFCAGAAIKPSVAAEIASMAGAVREGGVPWITGLGATESSPFAFCTGILTDVTSQRIGVPAPGVEVRLVPTDGLIEARLRGPNITPGYWRDEEQTRAAFDELGFYRLGDAVRLVDRNNPAEGFAFDGRLNENFKLSTGTWVRVGPLRRALLQRLGDLATDVVIGAPDCDALVALVFPNVRACRVFGEIAADRGDGEVLTSARVHAFFSDALRQMRSESHGSSTTLTRLALLVTPPSFGAGEITDKGSINQRAVLAHRAAVVKALYNAPEGAVITAGEAVHR